MSSVPLPPPTPLDLAVVRARLDGRQVLGSKGSWRWGRIAGLVLTVVVAFALAGRATSHVVAGDRAWYGASFVTFGAVVVAAGLVLRGAGRRVDRRVRQRLAADAPDGAAPEPRPAALRRFGLVAVPALLNGICLAVSVGIAAVRAAGAATPAHLVVLVGTGLLLAGYAAVVLDVGRAPVVGRGPVLAAVDSAVARRDVRAVALSPVFPLVLTSVASSQRATPALGLIYVAGLVLLVVVLGVSLRTADQDRALLEDYRLPSAPPPDVWLAGSPA